MIQKRNLWRALLVGIMALAWQPVHAQLYIVQCAKVCDSSPLCRQCVEAPIPERFYVGCVQYTPCDCFEAECSGDPIGSAATLRGVLAEPDLLGDDPRASVVSSRACVSGRFSKAAENSAGSLQDQSLACRLR